MTKERLAAFSDGVIAILITIMVLELHVPHGASWAALAPMAPTLSAYVYSFVFVAIYWNNHHHVLALVERVSGGILWANMHLLFWLSLVPWLTAWVGESHNAPVPTALYGALLIMNGLSYLILTRTIMRHQGESSRLKRALGTDVKGWTSLVLYLLALGSALLRFVWAADAVYVLVALIWLVPDRRIERFLHEEEKAAKAL